MRHGADGGFTSFTTGQSLEPILGKSPIVPGTYDLDVSIGDMHQLLHLEMK